MWSLEVLNHFPATLEYYPTQWVETLDRLSERELWEVSSRISFDSIKGSELHNFCSEIEELVEMPMADLSIVEFPRWAYVGVKGKKKHELDRFAALIEHIDKKYHFTSMTNLGGGMGHLSRMVAHYQKLPCIDIDMNETLQKQGVERMEKFPLPEGASTVEFISALIDRESANSNLVKEFKVGGITTGLHTCGPLAVRHMELAIKGGCKGLINFGCCYGKMLDKRDFNISRPAMVRPLELTNHALTLATRSHTEIGHSDFELKTRVKNYRYALHFLMHKELGVKEFITVGNGRPSHYRGVFSTYALDMLKRVEIEHDLTAEEIDLFFKTKETTDVIRRLYLMDIIRWLLGRALEQYILTDRAIYIEERGYTSELVQLFDEKVSPRNIGIVAIKN